MVTYLNEEPPSSVVAFLAYLSQTGHRRPTLQFLQDTGLDSRINLLRRCNQINRALSALTRLLVCN